MWRKLISLLVNVVKELADARHRPPPHRSKILVEIRWEGACIDIVTCKTRLQGVEDGRWKIGGGEEMLLMRRSNFVSA